MGNMSPPSLDHASEVITISTQILIGTIMAIFFAVVIAFFIYLYAKFYWSNNVEDHSIVLWRRRLARQRRTTPARLNRQGLDPTVVKSLQQVVYDSKDFNEGLECAVCLSEVSQGEKVRLLPKCNHGFHVDCIDMWFQSHSTCPLCRTPVIDTSSNDTINNSQLLDDDHSNSNSSPRNREVIQVFPENIVFWGNETQISTFGEFASGGASTSATSTGVNRLRNQEMVIEIPPSSHGLCEDCLSSPPPLEEGKTPVMTRLGSLKRLWSFGKKGASPSPRASSSSNVDHQA